LRAIPVALAAFRSVLRSGVNSNDTSISSLHLLVIAVAGVTRV
jgi:hypothetical protein